MSTTQTIGWILLGIIVLSLTIINITTPSKDKKDEH